MPTLVSWIKFLFSFLGTFLLCEHCHATLSFQPVWQRCGQLCIAGTLNPFYLSLRYPQSRRIKESCFNQTEMYIYYSKINPWCDLEYKTQYVLIIEICWSLLFRHFPLLLLYYYTVVERIATLVSYVCSSKLYRTRSHSAAVCMLWWWGSWQALFQTEAHTLAMWRHFTCLWAHRLRPLEPFECTLSIFGGSVQRSIGRRCLFEVGPHLPLWSFTVYY